ncbi:restriction endonuclease [Enterococcus hirae]|nr:restriction endonuclease [Enterococcus hirae]
MLNLLRNKLKQKESPKSTEKRPFAFLEKKITAKQSETIKKMIRQLLASSNERYNSTDLNILMREVFEKEGYRCQIIDGVYDGSIDIELFEENELIGAVQCKAYNPANSSGFVKKEDVAKFHSGCTKKKIKRMIFVTTSSYTQPAIEEYHNEIMLIDRKKLWELIIYHFPIELAEVINQTSMSSLKDCEKCTHGKLVKFRSNQGKYLFQCESCSALYYNDGKFYRHPS